MKHFLENSRYIVLLGVWGTLLASLALFLFSFAGVAIEIWHGLTVTEPFGHDNLKDLSIVLIQAIDGFLLATVLYIIALGLYELFIDDALDLPHWLEVHTLDDLKSRLLGVIIVILPVTFLGKLVEWKGGIEILWLGISVAVVLFGIASVQYIALFKRKLK